MAEPDALALDYLVVADAAEAVGGKIYLLGGGWDRLLVPQLPGPPGAPFAVAAGVSVPWGMTNKRLHLGVEVLDADGALVATLIDGQIEVGRPAGIRPGVAQRFQLAVRAQPQFTTAGRYVVRCTVDGNLLGSTAFEVAAAAPPQPPQA